MSVGYINLDPSRYASADGGDPNQAPDLTSLLGNANAGGPLEQQMRRSAQTFWADNAGPPEERAARQALNRFRSAFATAWSKYSQQTLADAHFGYSDHSDAIDHDRDKALASVTGDAQDIAAPILDGLHQQGMQIGLDHWQQQNQTLNQIQLAQANQPITADGTTLSDGSSAGMGDQRQMPVQVAQGGVPPAIKPPAEQLYTPENYQKAREVMAGVKNGTIGNLNWNIIDMIHDPKSNWDGSTTPEGAFDTFISPEEGSRAAYKNLLVTISSLKDSAKFEKPWLQAEVSKLTINNLARFWLGPKDDRVQWISNVAKASGLDPGEEIDVTDVNKVATLFHGVAIAERGVSPPQSEIIAGIKMITDGAPRPAVSLDEMHKRFVEISKHAPGVRPTEKNKDIRDIRPLLDKLWKEEFDKQDQRIKQEEDQAATIGIGPGHR